MRCNLNCICKKKQFAHIKKTGEAFARHLQATDLDCRHEDYWKENRCVDINIGFVIEDISLNQLSAEMERFFGKFGSIESTETNYTMNCAIYKSLPEILESDSIFLILFVEKHK
jgi:hypothetical protein